MQDKVDEWEAVQAMLVYYQQLEGSICLKSCSAPLGCPQPSQASGYNWSKLKQDLPLSTMMNYVQLAWEWIGRIDQGLIMIFVPLQIVLTVKVRRLENAISKGQGAVNVAISAPAILPMQNMAATSTQPSTADHPPAQTTSTTLTIWLFVE